MKKIILFGACAVALCAFANHIFTQENRQTLTDIKEGRANLYCLVRGERDYKHIDPEKVIDVREIDGKIIFTFTNGSASNCVLEHKL